MPLPKPKKNEKQNDFISRCMSSDVMQDEFSDHKQRIAVCYSQFRRKEEDAEKIAEIERKLDLVTHIEDLQEKAKGD